MVRISKPKSIKFRILMNALSHIGLGISDNIDFRKQTIQWLECVQKELEYYHDLEEKLKNALDEYMEEDTSEFFEKIC